MYQREVLVKCGVVSCMTVRQTELDGTDRGKPGLAFLDSDTYTRTENGVKTKGVNKWVWNKAKKPSALQRKKLIALALMSAAKTVLENHVYNFNRELYWQKKGGSIGEDFTNLSASLLGISVFFTKKWPVIQHS